jgi:3-hydroxyisobutyrate dehydrogenase
MPTPRRREIGFLGLGQMGQPMARRLVEAGFVVRAYDLSPLARSEFGSSGGIASTSPVEACLGASVVITMLPNGTIVRRALLDARAVAGALAGALVIDMSSSAPLQTRELGKDLKTLGLGLIDAPVSGGVKRATSGTLTIMAGGDVNQIEQARPVLETLGNSIFVVGPLGAGHAMKALNNYVSAAGLVAACEAVIVGQTFGLDPQTVVDVLNVSTGKNNSTDTKMKPFVLSGSFCSGFSMALMAKDIETAADLSTSIGANADGVRAAALLWRAASEQSGMDADHTAIFRYLVQRATKGGE